MVRGARRAPGDVCVYLVCRTRLEGTGSLAERQRQPEIAGHEERQESSWESCDPEPATEGDDREETLSNMAFIFTRLAPPTADTSKAWCHFCSLIFHPQLVFMTLHLHPSMFSPSIHLSMNHFMRL